MNVAFVCVQHAGRSQTAAAFGERANRNLEDTITVVTGGIQPAERVHEEVVNVMAAREIDLGDRTPREITQKELQDCEYVVTMGCSAEWMCPATWSGENRDRGSRTHTEAITRRCARSATRSRLECASCSTNSSRRGSLHRKRSLSERVSTDRPVVNSSHRPSTRLTADRSDRCNGLAAIGDVQPAE